MKNPLETYLHDHLAGATSALEALEALRDHAHGEVVTDTAADLITQIEKERGLLQQLAEAVGTSSNLLKEAVGWMAEKASRLKLRRETEAELGTFETLEALALGILGKEKLWAALAIAGRRDPRLRGHDYAELGKRAREQHARVEALRLDLAARIFTGP
jgi:hypothetical protein